MEPILQVEHLTKVFHSPGRPDHTAVDDVSFCLHAGETLGIVGESGSGKSTLARTVLRLLDSTSGTIRLCGEDITHAKGAPLREAWQQMQMVFQQPRGSFDPRRTLGHSIGEGLRNQGLSKAETAQRVEALLTQCGLPVSFAARYPHGVSGGQCQRAAIARALATEPKLVVCDEATSALDVTVQQQILELLQRLKEERQLSYLFISHDLALVQSFCDRVLVIQQGRVVEEGTPEQIIGAPQCDYTRTLVEAAFS